MQSIPQHVAIIMDGNGRWASRRGLPRTAGHRRGAKAVRRIVEFAAQHQVRELTLFAFSSDNWQRPLGETTVLMALLQQYLCQEIRTCLEQGIALEVIGRRDRLGRSLGEAIDRCEGATAAGERMRLRIAVDYSSRQSIAHLMMQCAASPSARQVLPSSPPHRRHRLSDQLASVVHAKRPIGDVDLLIRSGGERRLSDFLLLECAYAELYFTDVLWPDFTAQNFATALDAFGLRNRRFGGLSEASVTGQDPQVRHAR
ncbi:MAG: polyprenyl diphosphate synthase [Pseudomonadota bacterium]